MTMRIVRDPGEWVRIIAARERSPLFVTAGNGGRQWFRDGRGTLFLFLPTEG